MSRKIEIIFRSFRISNRFRVWTGKFRFYVGGSFDNCHVANQRHSWYSC